MLLISLINDSGLMHGELPLFLMFLMPLFILVSILCILLVQVRILVFQFDKSSIGVFISLVLLGLRVLFGLCWRWAYINLYRHVLRVHV